MPLDERAECRGQRDRASREGPTGDPSDAVAHRDGRSGERVVAVRLAGRRDRVRDRDEAIAEHARGDGDHLVGDVVAVEDEFRDDPIVEERSADRPGIR